MPKMLSVLWVFQKGWLLPLPPPHLFSLSKHQLTSQQKDGCSRKLSFFFLTVSLSTNI